MSEEPITMMPVIGWQPATLPESNVILVLQLVTGTSPSEGQLVQPMRIGLSAIQCRALAADLLQSADLTEQRAAAEAGQIY